MIQTEKGPHISYSILQVDEWTSRRENHELQLRTLLDPYLKKRSEQKKDPVLDFLFEYYKFRPSHLLRWSPGINAVLKISDEHNLPPISEFTFENNNAWINPVLFPKKRVRATRWIHELLLKTDEAKPFFGCFGMHEWAMVYRSKTVRHDQLPLRFSDDKIAEIVESQPILCTHFDAYRFFTDAAKPLNKHHLNRDTFQENEQPGCIHSNMDIYKWAYKYYPWVSSDLIRDAFFLAVQARTIDMKASPYDLRDRGLEPIKIETESGRKLYQKHQAEIMNKAKPVRRRLIDELENIIRVVD